MQKKTKLIGNIIFMLLLLGATMNECREVTEKYRTGRSAYLRLGQLFMRLFAGLL